LLSFSLQAKRLEPSPHLLHGVGEIRKLVSDATTYWAAREATAS
jgi:hypothetical protein